MTADGLMDRVRARLVLEHGEPTRAQVAALVREEAGGLLDADEVLRVVREAVDELGGAGPLERLLRAQGAAELAAIGALMKHKGDGA